MLCTGIYCSSCCRPGQTASLQRAEGLVLHARRASKHPLLVLLLQALERYSAQPHWSNMLRPCVLAFTCACVFADEMGCFQSLLLGQ